MKNRKTRKRAWKGVSGSINSTAQRWKLARLAQNWPALGSLSLGSKEVLPLIDVDAQDAILTIKFSRSRESESKVRKFFKRVELEGSAIVLRLALYELQIEFDGSSIQLWVISAEDLVIQSELHLTLLPLRQVTRPRNKRNAQPTPRNPAKGKPTARV